MNDGRAELIQFLEGKGWVGARTIIEVILERFDVIPKPVVTELQLGRMVAKAGCTQNHGDGTNVNAGQRMLEQLDAAGLMIVRRDEVRR